MSEQQNPEPLVEIDFDHRQLLGFRDLTGLGLDAGLVEEELDAAHVKIGGPEGPPQ